MMLALIILVALAVAEPLVIIYGGGIRSLIIKLVAAVSLIIMTMLLFTQPHIYIFIVWLVHLYKLLNAGRVIAGRMEETYLRSLTVKTSMCLTAIQVFTVLLAVLLRLLISNADSRLLWFSLAFTQLIAGAVMLSITRANTHVADEESPAIEDWPSLSVLIPARNETDDLERCLKSLIASDYPKMEIIVLDDCSQTSRTSQIIRDFAQHGVRFLPGVPPVNGWLAKNQAYQHLAEAANGELLLFCGVDVHYQLGSLRRLVEHLMGNQLQMLSVLPHNKLQKNKIASLQIMRYMCELLRPKRSGQPAVLSSVWLITKPALQAAGGFKAVSRTIIPEMYFARHAQKQHAYSFLLAREAYGIETSKGLAEQQATAIRTLYPLFHKKPQAIVLTSFVVFGLLIAPYFMILRGLFSNDWLTIIMCIPVIFCGVAVYRRVLIAAYGAARFYDYCNFIGAILKYLLYLHRSMYQYEFSVVDWKGRNVCLPAMHYASGSQYLHDGRTNIRNKHRKS